MRRSLPSFGLLVLSPLVFITAACNGTDVAFSATGPAQLVAIASVSSSFAVEPATLRPEILPGSCGRHSPFGARLGVKIHGSEALILRGVRFSFTDRFGTRALPEVIPIPDLLAPLPAGTTMPSSSPVTIPGIAPLPTTSPIQISGASSIDGVLVPAGAHRRFDFFLHFPCIVVAEGQVIVIIDAADRGGRAHTSELQVRVGP